MNKGKKITIFIVIVISIALIVGVSAILLDTTGIINQGNFRINDVVVTSKASIADHELQVSENTTLTDMRFNLSHTNTISILLTKGGNVKRAYLDNISIKSNAPTDNVVFYQTNKDEKYMYVDKPKEVEIYLEEKQDQYFIELNVENIEFIKEAVLPEGIQSIKYDGTLFKTLGLELEDIKLDISFNLNVIEENGRKNVCKFEITTPMQGFLDNGISIIREELSKFNFKVQD